MQHSQAVGKNVIETAALQTSLPELSNPGTTHWNLTTEELIDVAVNNGEGTLTSTGALACYTGQHTGRSPKDKFVVRDETTESNVDWGPVNQPMTTEHFNALYRDQIDHLAGKELFIGDSYVGAELARSVSVRTINETAWANLFARQLFRRYNDAAAVPAEPDFTIVHTPNFSANPEVHGTNSETFIVVNFSRGLVLIGGTKYAGEMKKSIFSILNYLYPLDGVMAMHCSANVGKENPDHAALFFGLSGTGKTTLSADSSRQLIGDDEHGWSDSGIFNFEGGCYAKCINLSEEKEPEIWNAIRRGAILENVTLNDDQSADYDDTRHTENTRAAYPVDFIEGHVPAGTGPHPQDIVFLTCDAFGVMPPISKLTTEQAMYHFLSGYTAKVAGTERGMGNSPEATFSTCFGSPFLPLKPTVYAELLGKKVNQHGSHCWLVNTGWIGGGVDTGNRIKLAYTRRMVEAALNRELDNATFESVAFFGLEVPTAIEGVPSEVLIPRNMWENADEYDRIANELAAKFVANFKQFESYAPELVTAGPKPVV